MVLPWLWQLCRVKNHLMMVEVPGRNNVGNFIHNVCPLQQMSTPTPITAGFNSALAENLQSSEGKQPQDFWSGSRFPVQVELLLCWLLLGFLLHAVQIPHAPPCCSDSSGCIIIMSFGGSGSNCLSKIIIVMQLPANMQIVSSLQGQELSPFPRHQPVQSGSHSAGPDPRGLGDISVHQHWV